MISATALEHGLTVVTSNVSDFAPTGVATLNPFNSLLPRKPWASIFEGTEPNSVRRSHGVNDMWTLVLVTLIASGASTGGVGAATSFLDFPDEAKCRTAANALAGTDQVRLGQAGLHPNISPSAIYRIIAQCVAR